MGWLIILGLDFLGWLLIMLEIFFIPGSTIVGILGGGLMVASIYMSYADIGMPAGNWTLAATAIFTVGTTIAGFRAGLYKKFALKHTNDSRVNEIDTSSINPGDSGKTLSRVATIGKAMINGQIVEVQSEGEYINTDTEIYVLKISPHKITIKTKTQS